MTTYGSAATARRRTITAHYLRTVGIKTVGVRGRAYDSREVDELLEQVAVSLETRAQSDADKDAEIARLISLESERRHGRLPNAIKDEIPEDALRAQREAQRYADQIIAAAQNGAADITRAARDQAESIDKEARDRQQAAGMGYRQRVAGGVYDADQEERERLAAAVDWLVEFLDGFMVQFGAGAGVFRQQLTKMREALAGYPADAPDDARAVAAAN